MKKLLALVVLAPLINGCTAEQRREFSASFERELLRQAVDAGVDRIEKRLDVELDGMREKLDDAADDSSSGVWAGLGTLAAMLTAGGARAASGVLRSKVGKRDETG